MEVGQDEVAVQHVDADELVVETLRQFGRVVDDEVVREAFDAVVGDVGEVAEGVGVAEVAVFAE